MRMDAPDPTTHVTLQSSSGAALKDLDWPGEWSSLGFSRAANAYVLSLTSTVGAWRGVVAIRFLDESAAFHDSKGAGSHFFAFSSVASSDLGAIAFVSQRRETPLANAFRLELLDLSNDSMRDLGAAPAPPPLGKDSPFCKGNAPRKWGDDNTGSWEPMDADIIVFDAGKVRATYGADTCRARATKRTTQEWPLAAPALPAPPTKL
jgi:hypothetical protein